MKVKALFILNSRSLAKPESPLIKAPQDPSLAETADTSLLGTTEYIQYKQYVAKYRQNNVSYAYKKYTKSTSKQSSIHIKKLIFFVERK